MKGLRTGNSCNCKEKAQQVEEKQTPMLITKCPRSYDNSRSPIHYPLPLFRDTNFVLLQTENLTNGQGTQQKLKNLIKLAVCFAV